MSKQQSSNTSAKTSAREAARINLPFSSLFSTLSNECEAKLTALDAESDRLIVAIQEEANEAIRKIQWEADQKIKDILLETVEEASRLISRMGKKMRKKGKKAINSMRTTEIELLVAACVEAEAERNENAGNEVDEEIDKVELGYDPDPDKEMFL